MKRWNGWGNVNTDYPVPTSAEAYLAYFSGSLDKQLDATTGTVFASIPDSRLPLDPVVDVYAEVWVTQARGQSLPDWLIMRSGRL